MNEPRIPVSLAVGFWIASGLAVLGYTYIAFRETASGAIENFAVQGGVEPSLVAAGNLLSSELSPDKKTPLNNLLTPVHGTHPQAPFKPLERGKFK